MNTKFITVRTENSVKIYSAGWQHSQNDKGEWEEVERTDEEQEQSCYQHLIRDIERKEFDKNLISLLENHLSKNQMSNWKNISIKISYSDYKHCEMNISNPNALKEWVEVNTDKLNSEL